MSFPRKYDGSLDFDAFEMLSPEEKREAVLFVKHNNPGEIEIVREYIVEHRRQMEARIAEADARIAKRDAEIKEGEAFIQECLAQNRVLSHMRQQYVEAFVENSGAALNAATTGREESKKNKCNIM